MAPATWTVLLLLAAATSGCLAHGGPQGGGPISPAGASSPASNGSVARPPPEPAEATAPADAPDHWYLTGCASWEVSSAAAGGAGAPAPRPDGWAPNPEPLFAYRITGVLCDRASIGEFERGPIRFLFDGHNDVDFPPGCTNDTHVFATFQVVNSFWTDDAQVGAFLAQAYGLPVQVSSFGDTTNGSAPSAFRQWSWGIDGKTSRVTVWDDGMHEGEPRIPDRLFWPTATGIASMELVYSGRSSQGERTGYGTVVEPMLLAHRPGGRFIADSANWDGVGDATVTLTQYDDLLCEEPDLG